jgi:hypothetical protein
MEERKKEKRKVGRKKGRKMRKWSWFSRLFVGASFIPPFLLLNLTGASWRLLEIQKRHRTDRKWGQVCWALTWRHPTLIASLSLFFKALLLCSSLKPCF